MPLFPQTNCSVTERLWCEYCSDTTAVNQHLIELIDCTPGVALDGVELVETLTRSDNQLLNRVYTQLIARLQVTLGT